MLKGRGRESRWKSCFVSIPYTVTLWKEVLWEGSPWSPHVLSAQCWFLVCPERWKNLNWGMHYLHPFSVSPKACFCPCCWLQVCLCCVMQCLHRQLSLGFVFPYGTIQHYLKILAWDLDVAELYCSDSSLSLVDLSQQISGHKGSAVMVCLHSFLWNKL